MPQLLPKTEWFSVDVITCAAPYVAKCTYVNSEVLLQKLKSRIKNIFEVARDNRVKVLILGAFGCGAFKNPPYLVAEAFRQVIDEQKYQSCFEHIVFAIKPTSEFCPNVSAFRMIFSEYTYSDDEETAILYDTFKHIRFCKKTEFVVESFGSSFTNWQSENPYFGKQFSVLGDSISRLEGFTPEKNIGSFCIHTPNPPGFYKKKNSEQTGIIDKKDMWWGKVIDFFGGELLINGSYPDNYLRCSSDMCKEYDTEERISPLHIDNVRPDVIIIYLGINDWFAHLYTRHEDSDIFDKSLLTVFDRRYAYMLDTLKARYPDSEIWCCTLCNLVNSDTVDISDVNPMNDDEFHIEIYNDCIRNITRQKNCRLVDVYREGSTYISMDGFHPTAYGMTQLAIRIIYDVIGAEADQFISLRDRKTILHQNTDREIEYKKEMGFQDRPLMEIVNKKRKDRRMENSSDKYSSKEYIYRDLQATSFLVSDTIHLTDISGELVKVFQSAPVLIGSLKSCDWCVENQMLEMRHAEMLFKDGYWFLRDYASSQGTYLNGKRLEAGKYYQLLAGDELVFGRADPVYFEKLERRVWADDVVDTMEKIEQKLGIRKCNTDMTGKIAGKYTVLREISSTLFIRTYLVEDAESSHIYVLKLCDKTQQNYSPAVRDGLILEAYMMQELEHFAIPRVREVVETDDMLGMVREYVEGISLEQYMEVNGIPAAEKVIEWAKMVCDILQYLHTMTPPHIYRDVKPANLILDTKDRIHMIDFGIMRTYKKGQSKDTAILGTAGYAAPEQYGSRQTDQRTDIYGLGMTMYRLVTGENVLDRSFVVKPVREINPKLPKGLEYIISKCIELDPDKRYQSCDELLKDLCRYEKLPEQKGFFRKIFGRK